MPSITHEGFLQPFENRPDLVVELLSEAFAVKVPAWGHAKLGSAELTEVVPATRRADLVVVLWNDNRPALAVILEVQLREDKRKRFTWPLYLTSLRARLECPTMLLVISPRRATATWCADPIALGHPDLVLHPLVLGPDRVPVVTDVDQARRSPELAVLSALAHGGAHPRQEDVLEAFLAALQQVTGDRAQVYHDIVSAVLPAAARRSLEDLMATKTYKFRSEFALTHIARGKAEGKAQALVEVLAARGIDLPDDARQRITQCADLDQLDVWIRRAATAGSIDEVFAE